MIDYKQKLMAFDRNYFDYFIDEDYEKIQTDGTDASYYLATYLYDHDFSVDEDSWEILELIKKCFPELYEAVLFNIFNRNHDT